MTHSNGWWDSISVEDLLKEKIFVDWARSLQRGQMEVDEDGFWQRYWATHGYGFPGLGKRHLIKVDKGGGTLYYALQRRNMAEALARFWGAVRTPNISR